MEHSWQLSIIALTVIPLSLDPVLKWCKIIFLIPLLTSLKDMKGVKIMKHRGDWNHFCLVNYWCLGQTGAQKVLKEVFPDRLATDYFVSGEVYFPACSAPKAFTASPANAPLRGATRNLSSLSSLTPWDGCQTRRNKRTLEHCYTAGIGEHHHTGNSPLLSYQNSND